MEFGVMDDFENFYKVEVWSKSNEIWALDAK